MEADEIGEEDMIPDEETIITITRDGYIKRVPMDTYRAQRRGGRGKIGATAKEEDKVTASVRRDHAPLRPVLHRPRARLSTQSL